MDAEEYQRQENYSYTVSASQQQEINALSYDYQQMYAFMRGEQNSHEYTMKSIHDTIESVSAGAFG